MRRRFEITGIPIHLWNELTIESIGSCIGKVKEIHDVKHSFDTTELTIDLDERRLLQRSVTVIEGGFKHQVWTQVMKIVIIMKLTLQIWSHQQY